MHSDLAMPMILRTRTDSLLFPVGCYKAQPKLHNDPIRGLAIRTKRSKLLLAINANPCVVQ